MAFISLPSENICRHEASWIVNIDGLDASTDTFMHYERMDNTFEAAMERLYFAICKDADDIMNYDFNIDIHGEMTTGYGICIESKAFRFAIPDIETFITMGHYTFAKGRTSIADFMAMVCKPSEDSELNLDAFTVGTRADFKAA